MQLKSSFTTTIFSFVLAGLFVTACSTPAPAKTIEPITGGADRRPNRPDFYHERLRREGRAG